MRSLRPLHHKLLAALAVVAAAPLACGASDKPAASASFSLAGDAGTTGPGASPGQPCAPGQPCPPPQICPDGRPCEPQPCPPGQACPQQAPAAPTTSGSAGDPNALASLIAAAAAAGSAFLAPMGGGDPVEAGIKAAAARYAPGMSPDGQMAKGTLTEGGHVGFIFNMEPSKCYTIIGFGIGVTDLDLNLLAPPFYNILAGQDGMAGPTAVIGSSPKPMCPIAPIAVPYKIDIYAKKGAGNVGAQVYSKPK